MRVAILHPFLDKPRGAELQVARYAEYLLNSGHEVGILTFVHRPESFQYSDLIDGSTVVEMLPRLKRFGRRAYRRLGRNLVLAAMVFARFRPLLEQYDVINAHNHPMEWVSAYVRRPTVWTCNEPPLWEYFPSFSYPLSRIVHPYLVRHLSRIVTLDSQMMRMLAGLSHYRNLTVVGSGADLLRPVTHVENDTLDVLFVGPLHPQKRPMDVVRVCAGLRQAGHEVLLHVVGEDLSGGRLTQELSESPVPTRQHGQVDVDSLYHLYDVADLALFLPERQPWGIFPLEAALAGIPTVVSDQCGFLSHLADDWPFPVVPTGDVQAAVTAALAAIAELTAGKALAHKVASQLAERLSWSRVGRRVEKILLQAMAETKGRARGHRPMRE